MRTKPWKWGLALGLSGILHAGAAAVVMSREPEVRIAGGQGVEIELAGPAFQPLLPAADPGQAVAPGTHATGDPAPVEPEVTTAEPVEPVETMTAVPVEPEAPRIEEALETEQAELPEPEAIEPAEPEVATAEPEPEEVEPEAAEEEAVALVSIPRPTPRPHYEPPKAAPRQQQAETPRQREPARQRAQRAAGSGGQDSQDAQRGNAGTATARAAASQGSARSTASGNAAVSNYPGQVVSKLRRSLRYPREAQRARMRGEVRVSFTVASNGSVSGIRVVSSSGSPILDQAAIETVQRAAPFPAIPADAGRSSWPFTVPLAFIR
jgi:periplasmic protein TonB